MFATTILGYTLSTAMLILWGAIILFIWAFLVVWPAMIAKSKGRSFWLYFFLSIPFWWITLFVVLFMKDEEDATA